MIATRLAIALFALFASILVTLAAPAEVNTEAAAPVEEHQLKKRVTHIGDATYYEPGLGGCGWVNGTSDYILAIALNRAYDANKSNCGQWMRITNPVNGKSAWGQVVDFCVGCKYDDVDLSPTLFDLIANRDQGRLKVEWHFESKQKFRFKGQ